MSSSSNLDLWDYVIVGGGSAGCVLARRLSEDPYSRVLLLEAGDEAQGLPFRVPALIQKLPTESNWLYPVEPDTSRRGTLDPWNNGRVLGGGSSTNAMLWVRGNPGDFDAWAATGCNGWEFKGVLPYFRRAEQFEDGTSRYRGGGGPQSIARMRVPHSLTDRFLSAAGEVGFRVSDDYNAEDQEVAALAQVNQRGGLRNSVVDAYLKPIRLRPNLDIVTGAFVRKILFEGRRATGVEYDLAGARRRASCTREVIISAGAIGSPKLLMLSGIGDPETLTRIGIPVVANSPGVGKNLQEHPSVSMVYKVNERTLNQDITPLRMARHVLDFLFYRRGALTSPAAHALAFGKWDAAATVPDYELIFVAFGLAAASDEPSGRETGVDRLRRLTARSGGRSDGRQQAASESLVSVRPTLLHPRTRGDVSLRSTDPEEPPLVRHELLGDPLDVQGLIGACRRVREIFAAPALRSAVVEERTPGARVETDEEWESYLRTAAGRLNHPSGTCRMGNDDPAVVDTRLRVRGVEGLRVIDASIMPTITSGNTNAPTIMIAEKGSDLVRADAG